MKFPPFFRLMIFKNSNFDRIELADHWNSITETAVHAYILSINVVIIVRLKCSFFPPKWLFYSIKSCFCLVTFTKSFIVSWKQYHAIKIYPNVFQDQLNYSTKSTIQTEFYMLLMHTEVYVLHMGARLLSNAYIKFATRSIRNALLLCNL